jgi:hypothetical protein
LIGIVKGPTPFGLTFKTWGFVAVFVAPGLMVDYCDGHFERRVGIVLVLPMQLIQ